MSIFEMTMLLCFGISWPLAIYKTWRSKNPVSKSLLFLYIVIAGYIAGCCHKIIYSFDPVFWLYCINLLMVITDLILTLYYSRTNNFYSAPIANRYKSNLQLKQKEMCKVNCDKC